MGWGEFKGQSRNANSCITDILAKGNKEKRQEIVKEIIQENSKGY